MQAVPARSPRQARFPVVCIGMSAGGLKPLETIFRQLKPNSGVAFVIIAHSARNTPTRLPWLLHAWSGMPAELARPGMLFEPDHIYVIPPGKEVFVEDGYFSVHPRSKFYGWSNVLTLFLESLTRARTPPGIAVILSGIDADGAAALGEFQEKGGITIAQEPQSAAHEGMPQAAIETGSVNFVLPPERIAAVIEALAAPD